MSTEMSVAHAEVIFLDELLASIDPVGRYIRTIGVIEAHHVLPAVCILNHRSQSVPVDLELIRAEISVGSTYQIFGEVQQIGSKVLIVLPRIPFITDSKR